MGCAESVGLKLTVGGIEGTDDGSLDANVVGDEDVDGALVGI